MEKSGIGKGREDNHSGKSRGQVRGENREFAVVTADASTMDSLGKWHEVSDEWGRAVG